eukprot:ANDGO_02171.mRNA.1 Alpha N-terminal protein methyltransferase 1
MSKASITSTDELKDDQWYSKAIDYWTTVPATIDGVLGGFGRLDPIDASTSLSFIDKLSRKGRFCKTSPSAAGTVLPEPCAAAGESHVLDVGAGVGRVSAHILLHRFATADLLEPVAKFLERAREDLSPTNRVRSFMQIGMQDFEVQLGADGRGIYDCVWIQWVIGHLTDAVLVEFLGKCIASLRTDGRIVVKDNVCQEAEWVHDKQDSSVTRSDKHLRHLFSRAGLSIVHSEQQKGFPQDLFPVYMYCLQPIPTK